MVRKIVVSIFVLTCCTTKNSAQARIDSFGIDKINKHIQILASDSLKGRANFSKELLIAGKYIATEFTNCNMKAFPGSLDFYLPFNAGVNKKLFGEDQASSLYNIVGLLPGKSKPAEIIMFSAHYDHVGVNKQLYGDSIFNGANDNASGVAALLSLAEYYSLRGDNERTIIFCAFAEEERGLLGSADFAEMINPESIKAVINLEMLGKTTIGRRGDFFITGGNLSDLRKIFQKNLRGNKARIINEPSAFMLFKRSDNYPFALKGIPAHTIMSSYDNDPCYHKPCDDMESIDVKNIQQIANAASIACETLISGKDTPARIKVKKMK